MWAWQVEFADNQECIDLIELAPEGIFPTLEEELNMPKASDLTFTEKVVISAAFSHCYSYRLFGLLVPLFVLLVPLFRLCVPVSPSQRRSAHCCSAQHPVCRRGRRWFLAPCGTLGIGCCQLTAST